MVVNSLSNPQFQFGSLLHESIVEIGCCSEVVINPGLNPQSQSNATVGYEKIECVQRDYHHCRTLAVRWIKPVIDAGAGHPVVHSTARCRRHESGERGERER